MKNFRILAMMIGALLILGSASSAAAQNQKNGKKSAEITFVVSGMDCANCKKKMDAKLPFEKGVKDYKSDLKARTVWFKYDPSKTTPEALKAAVGKTGFKAEEQK